MLIAHIFRYNYSATHLALSRGTGVAENCACLTYFFEVECDTVH